MRTVSTWGVALVAALVAATTASADPNHTRPPRPDFRPDGKVVVGGKTYPTHTAWFSSAEFRNSGARCGAAETAPATFASPSDCSLFSTTIDSEYNDNRVFVIQVVFHVIKRTDGVGAISEALIRSQIDILNEDFQAIAGTLGEDGTNTKLEFVLARFTPEGTPTNGIEVVTNNSYFSDPGGSPNDMKQALNWDPERYLNIYTNDAAGFLGYATFPSEEAGGTEDGVVLLYDSVGRNSPGGPPYNLGRTATHEVGHYMGLLHTFEGGCGSTTQPYSTGDLIADTQREADAEFGCSPGPSACGGGNNPIENYMDYSDDACMTKFTAEQGNRIRCSMVNFRTINTKPTAGFTFDADLLAVAFTSTSTDAQSSAAQLHYNWDFGDGATSTSQNPSHTYAAAGTYVVSLEVVDPGSGSSTETQSVTVTSAPLPPDAAPGTPDADPNAPDADPNAPDADPGNPGDGEGGGCCQTQGAGPSYLLCAIPVGLMLRRRRRRA